MTIGHFGLLIILYANDFAQGPNLLAVNWEQDTAAPAPRFYARVDFVIMIFLLIVRFHSKTFYGKEIVWMQIPKHAFLRIEVLFAIPVF